jgi:hypothetical protein
VFPFGLMMKVASFDVLVVPVAGGFGAEVLGAALAAGSKVTTGAAVAAAIGGFGVSRMMS